MTDFYISNPGNFIVYSGSTAAATVPSAARQSFGSDQYYQVSTGSGGGTFTGEFQARVPSTPISGVVNPLVNSWVPIVANNMTMDGLTSIITGSGLYWLSSVNGLETRINFTAMSVSGAVVVSYISSN